MLERPGRHTLRVKAVEEPERTVRIDNLRRGSLFHRIFQRFYAEWSGEGSPALAPGAEQRMCAIAEEECDAAQARGRRGTPRCGPRIASR